MIRPARPEDLPGIKRLWMQAFHDSEAATDFYFDHRMPRADLLDCLLIDTRGGELRGMLSLLPIDLVSGGVSYPARYFFAIATDERFRRMGISTALIGEAERITMERGGVASLLVPANPPLFDFYGKRGYEMVFSYQPAVFEGAGIGDCPSGARLLPAEPEDILRLRDTAFSKSRLYVRWDAEALGFVIKASRAWDAPLLRFALGGERATPTASAMEAPSSSRSWRCLASMCRAPCGSSTGNSMPMPTMSAWRGTMPRRRKPMV